MARILKFLLLDDDQEASEDGDQAASSDVKTDKNE